MIKSLRFHVLECNLAVSSEDQRILYRASFERYKTKPPPLYVQWSYIYAPPTNEREHNAFKKKGESKQRAALDRAALSLTRLPFNHVYLCRDAEKSIHSLARLAFDRSLCAYAYVYSRSPALSLIFFHDALAYPARTSTRTNRHKRARRDIKRALHTCYTSTAYTQASGIIMREKEKHAYSFSRNAAARRALEQGGISFAENRARDPSVQSCCCII